MTETLEAEKIEIVSIMNRGFRTYDGKAPDGTPRLHPKGAVLPYSKSEAEKMLIYSDLVDISKMPGQVDVSQIKSENAALKAENADLKKQLAALRDAEKAPEAKESAPESEGRPKKKKGYDE